MSSKMRVLVSTLALAGGLTLQSLASAHAQAGGPTTPEEEQVIRSKNPDLIGSFDIDTSIPDAPGFAVIGVEPASVLDPGIEPITFASLNQFLDEDNNLKTGFAVGGTPYWWFNREKKLADYRDDKQTGWLERVAARASISAAFADGGESKTDRLGFGVKTDLLDDGDYRRDTELYNCVADAYFDIGMSYRTQQGMSAEESQRQFAADARQQLVEGGNANPTDEQVFELSLELEEAHRTRVAAGLGTVEAKSKADVESCREAAAKRYAVKPSLIVAAGVGVDLDNGDATDWEKNGGAVWAAYRRPFAFGQKAEKDPDTNYFTVFGKYAFDEKETIGTEDVTSNAAVAGLIGGYETDTMKIAVQVGYKWVDYDANTAGAVDDNYSVYAIGASWKVNKGLWLKIDAGETGERQAVTDGKNSYLKVSFAYDIG